LQNSVKNFSLTIYYQELWRALPVGVN